MSEAQDKKIDELERELLGIQEMIYFLLQDAGEPVVITKEVLQRGIDGDKMISVVEDNKKNAFVFSLTNIGDVDEQ